MPDVHDPVLANASNALQGGAQDRALANGLERLVAAADDLDDFITETQAVVADLVETDVVAYAEMNRRTWSFRGRWPDDRSDLGALLTRYHQLMAREAIWSGSRSGMPQQFSDFMDDTALYGTAMYCEVLNPLHVNRGAFFGFGVDPGITIQFGLFRQSRQPYPESARATLARLRPVLARLYGLSLVRTWSRLSPADKLAALDVPLTARQRQVAQLLTAGLTAEAIAETLGISIETSRNHIRAVYDRLAVQNRVQLTLALTSQPPVCLPLTDCFAVGSYAEAG